MENPTGYISLIVFVIGILGLLTNKIPLPVQTVLLLVTLINIFITATARLLTPNLGIVSILNIPSEVLGGIILHPLTALLAGLLMAGALSASGGFQAIKVILDKLKKTPLGLPGTMVIITMTPLIFLLPCGRILGAALLPLLFSFGPMGIGVLNKTQTIVLIAAFARNAFGSCGPSPIGGVGQIGEGFLGQVGYLRAPQEFSLILGTAFMALFVKLITAKLFPNDVLFEDKPKEAKPVEEIKAPWEGYFSLAVFVFTLVASLFELFGKVPVQTIMVAGAVIILFVARIKIEDLMSGIILMPATAMAAGFLAAGSLDACGGFKALGDSFTVISKFPLLGVAGMLIIFSQIQTILPLSCSRILTAALVPVLFTFGPSGANLINDVQLAIIMAAYMINATTSCAPSPLGGAGMMAEGAMRAESGYLKAGFSYVSLVVLSPLSALFMKYSTVPQFAKQTPDYLLGFALPLLMIIVNFGLIYAIDWKRKTMEGDNKKMIFNIIAFAVAGIIAGIVIAYSLDYTKPLELLQGAIGGLISGVLMALMLPK